jgi:hypothetical protein
VRNSKLKIRNKIAENAKSTIFESTEAYGITSLGKFTFLRSDAFSTRLCVAELIDV